MAFMLARLDEMVTTSERRVWFRGRAHQGEVSGTAASRPSGTAVFLESDSPPWVNATPAIISPWPDNLGTVQQLQSLPHRVRAVRDIQAELTVWGTTTVDDRGVPCEVGTGRAKGSVFIVLNYAGWSIGALGHSTYQVLEYDCDGKTIWVLPPTTNISTDAATASAVQVLPPQRLAATAYQQTLLPVATSHGIGFHPDGSTTRPSVLTGAPVPAPLPLPEPPRLVNRRIKFTDVGFADRTVSVEFDGAPVVASVSWSRAVFNEIRSSFDAEFPEGVHIRGRILPDGSRDLALVGLDAAGRNFRELWYKATVRRSRRERRWLDADAVAKERPGAGMDDEALDLFDIEEFALQSRKDGFRLLYGLRSRDEPVRILPGHGFVVPIQTKDGVSVWYAWETVDTKNATYLFRPADEVSLGKLLAWTARQGATRMELIGNPAKRAGLGFVCRIFHWAGEDHLERWWAEILNTIGLSTP